MFAIIGHKLLSHPKVKVSHSVESGVSATHYHKDIPHRDELFIHATLLIGILLVVNHPGEHPLRKYMEKIGWYVVYPWYLGVYTVRSRTFHIHVPWGKMLYLY